MAKKGKRNVFNLACSECKTQNYVTIKNKINDPERLEFNKFCSVCRKVQPHKEVKK